MATLIEWNGKETEVHPKNAAQGFTLPELYKLIDCELVEITSLADGRLMVMDEMGRIRVPRPPVNVKATMIYQVGRATGLAILGSVVVGCPGEIL
jgi:hypothetical protein